MMKFLTMYKFEGDQNSSPVIQLVVLNKLMPTPTLTPYLQHASSWSEGVPEGWPLLCSLQGGGSGSRW